MSEPFRDLLARRRFTKVFEHYDDRHFGNEELVYASPEMSLKFVRDRSEISLDVGLPDGSSWYMAPRLLEYLKVADDLYGPADATLLRRQATLIDQTYEVIADLFRPENIAASQDELRKFWKKKAEEMFPRDDVSEYGPH